MGIAAFVIQEIPYIIMPFIKPASNPIMNMQNEMDWDNTRYIGYAVYDFADADCQGWCQVISNYNNKG